ncbi:MAG: T9SS type A sorting domain-containing protein [Bacteroidales bacterium]|nr:T9SS type A sorting domain-containing protein [Bacteroidales bacterium]
MVDSMTLTASWEAPRDVLIFENFEGNDFPPEGWQSLTQNIPGWYASDSGSIPGFTIPPHSTYAVVTNADDNGNGCCDYLILPGLDLRNRPDYQLSFSGYYTGAFEQTATIEISFDQGASWNVVYSVSPAPFSWNQITVDLSGYCGNGGSVNALLAFHAGDSGGDGSGWAIDDVSVRSGIIPVLGYGVHLDGLLLDYTPETTYSMSHLLNYGQYYNAGVSALYSSGYSDPDTNTFISRFLFPARNLEGDMPVYTDYVHLWWDRPEYQIDTTYVIPGLTGYNIYRDNILLAFVEQPLTEFFDLSLAPGIYSYQVKAVYDLGFYGFPGQTDESAATDPIVIDFQWCFQLPFTEYFNTGLFETNQWNVEGNWRIAGQAGSPAPSAEFYYNPATTDYSSALTSFCINGIHTDGSILLDFDLKHTLTNATGAEYLAIEVFNGSSWLKVAEYSNTESTGWFHKSLDITAEAKGNLFRIRFRAYGSNSLDIFNWMIDNIHVFRECRPPLNLRAEIHFPDTNDVILQWEDPDGGGSGVSAWLGWDNGINDDAIGLTNGGTFSVAVRFTPAQLVQYAGTSLTRIRMFPYAAGGTIALKVWTGANASTLVLIQPVASYTEGVWNEFTLTSPVAVTGATELWFGYTITHAAGSYIAGCDAGPAVAGFGDMISLDGSVWESMSSVYGLDYNWNLNGYVESLANVASLRPLTDETVYGPGSSLVHGHLPDLPYALVSDKAHPFKAGRGLVGYNVWRDGDLIGNTAENSFTDIDLDAGWYCYTISAVYEDCESEFTDDYCIVIRSVNKTYGEEFIIYPIPAGKSVYFDFQKKEGILLLYNLKGEQVDKFLVSAGQLFELDVSAFSSGIYFAKFTSVSGEIITGKIIVN